MRKYNLVNRQILFTFLVFLSIPASLFIGCSRSEDALPEKTENDVLKKFFNVPESASQAANAVAALIKRQNEKTHFIENFIKRVGYPKWDKAMEFAPNNSGVSGRFQSDDVSIIYIPFVRETENHVNASLIVKMEPSDTLFRMLYDKQYTRFGFDSTSENRWNAKNVFHIFSRFDNLVFGYTKFIIKDGRIFGKDSASPYQIKLLQENSISGSGRLSMVQPITVCNTYVICGECAAFRTSSLACCNPYSQTVCTTYWIDMGGDGTGGVVVAIQEGAEVLEEGVIGVMIHVMAGHQLQPVLVF